MNPNESISGCGKKFVLAMAGGGPQAIGELVRYGGMSDVLLRAHSLQATAATAAYLGHEPDRYASPEVARQLAMAAFREAMALAPGSEVFGIGATSVLGRPAGERPAREHKAYIALQRPVYTLTAEVALRAPRTRVEEEQVVADLVGVVVRWGAPQFADMRPLLRPEDGLACCSTVAQPGWEDLICGRRHVVGTRSADHILATSGNPLHDGHLGMIAYVKDRLGAGVDLELCVRNAAKPPLDYHEIRVRLTGMADALGLAGPPENVLLTDAGRFAEKAALFPGATFLMGTDTLRRVVDPSARDVGAVAEALRRHEARLLVFPRPGEPMPSIPRAFARRCTFVGEGYEPSPLSSTQIRSGACRG